MTGVILRYFVDGVMQRRRMIFPCVPRVSDKIVVGESWKKRKVTEVVWQNGKEPVVYLAREEENN